MPILAFSIVLVAAKVSIQLPDDVQNQPLRMKLQRIDFAGSVTLVGAVGCLLLGFSLKSTEELDWLDPIILGLFVSSGIFSVMFVLVESYWAPYPVMPMRLITQRTPLAVSMSNFFASIAAFSVVCNQHSLLHCVDSDSVSDLQHSSGQFIVEILFESYSILAEDSISLRSD